MNEFDNVYNVQNDTSDENISSNSASDMHNTVESIKSQVSQTAGKVTNTVAEAKEIVYSDVKDGVTMLKDKYQQDIQPKVIQMKDQLQQNLISKKDAANTILHEKVLDNNFSFKNLVMVFIAGWFVGRLIRN